MTTMRNSVQLIGRPGTEPEMKTVNDRKFVRFNLAVDDSYVNSNHEVVPNTQWFTLVAWGRVAERVIKVVHKGKQIAVQGTLRNNDWVDSNGQHRYSTEINIDDLFVIDWSDAKAE